MRLTHASRLGNAQGVRVSNRQEDYPKEKPRERVPRMFGKEASAFGGSCFGLGRRWFVPILADDPSLI